MSRDRVRIVFVSNTDVFFLTSRLPLALAEQARGAEIVVAAPEGEARAEIEQAGFRFVPLPLSRRGMNPLRELPAFLTLLRLYRDFRPHLVHHLTIKPVLYGSLAARMVGNVAVANAVTGLGFVFTDAPLARAIRPLVKLMYRVTQQDSLTRTLFENPDDRREFLSMGMVREEQAVLIPGMGVNCERFRVRPEPAGDPVVVMPCRMLWDKGVGCFVEAAKVLRERGVAARFALVGVPDPGNPSSIQRSQLEEWHGEGTVEWWGQRDDMPEVFARASIVSLPTYYREGIPRVLMEAAASGRAIVATEMPGCREIVRPGVNGVLVPPREPSALAEAIGSLLVDDAQRTRLGLAGREIVEREYSEERVLERVMRLHQELLVRRREAGGRRFGTEPLAKSAE